MDWFASLTAITGAPGVLAGLAVLHVLWSRAHHKLELRVQCLELHTGIRLSNKEPAP